MYKSREVRTKVRDFSQEIVGLLGNTIVDSKVHESRFSTTSEH